jgi:hypothetical protein
MFRLFAFFALVTSAVTALPSIHPVTTSVAGLKEPMASAALQVRGGGAVAPEVYVKTVSVVAGIYCVQLFLTPKMFQDMHFEGEADNMHEFHMRGTVAHIVPLIYAISKLDADMAAKVSFWWMLSIGLMYPWNAKFGYLTKTWERKQFHIVPEVLFVILTITGALAAF